MTETILKERARLPKEVNGRDFIEVKVYYNDGKGSYSPKGIYCDCTLCNIKHEGGCTVREYTPSTDCEVALMMSVKRKSKKVFNECKNHIEYYVQHLINNLCGVAYADIVKDSGIFDMVSRAVQGL